MISITKVPHLSSMALATVYNSVSLTSTMVQGRVCLIHETLVQHRKNILGILHKTNLTVVKVHNCPIYTRCCNVDNTCCFDSSWFWSTVGIILFMVFLGLAVSAYGWYQKKYHRTVASTAAPASLISTANNGTAPVMALQGPRSAAGQPTQPSVVCPKPPAYSSIQTVSTPQPGAMGPEVVCHEEPPPYSPMAAAAAAVAAASPENFKSVCTQTTLV